MTIKEMTKVICEAASDKKARDIVVMDMQGLTSSTDYFVICSANTATQVRAIADNVEEEMDKAGISFDHKEGYREGEWVLMDYGDVIIHIFNQEDRLFFDLERIWKDGQDVGIADLQD